MKSCKFKQLIRYDSACYMNAPKIKGGVKGIVIHGTATNNAKLGRWVKTDNQNEIAFNPNENYFGGKNNLVTPHATIGVTDGADSKDKIMLVQILPYDHESYGCGSGKYGSYNRSHIQIEMCQDVNRGKEYLNNILNSTAEWCADVMYQVGGFTVEDIVSHKEANAKGYASPHGDPENWLDLYGITMNDFREMVSGWYRSKYGDSAETPKKLYRVQVGAFTNRKYAAEFVEHLKEDFGLECFIVEANSANFGNEIIS